MFLYDIPNLGHLILCVEIAGRIVRVANQDSLGLFRNLLLEFFYWRQFESVFYIGLD